MSWVAILMGSESDWPTMRGCADVLGDLGVGFEVRVTSAHRTPAATADYVADAIGRAIARLSSAVREWRRILRVRWPRKPCVR